MTSALITSTVTWPISRQPVQKEIKQAAIKLLPEKNYTLVVVGKASEVKKQLGKYGRWEEKKITDPDF